MNTFAVSVAVFHGFHLNVLPVEIKRYIVCVHLSRYSYKGMVENFLIKHLFSLGKCWFLETRSLGNISPLVKAFLGGRSRQAGGGENSYLRTGVSDPGSVLFVTFHSLSLSEMDQTWLNTHRYIYLCVYI